MINIFKLLKDIISPKKCYSCNIEWFFLCKKCALKLRNFWEKCFVCKRKSLNYLIHKVCLTNIYYDKVLILTHYNNKIIKKLIRNWKYSNKKDIFEDFWDYLWELLLNNIDINDSSEYILISSPMYFYKKMLRGYNQADILAKKVSLKTWLKYEKNLIKKIKNTVSQATLSKKGRENNLKWLFKVNKRQIKNIKWKKIVIIDDIITTWSTLNEISKELKINWAIEVIWLVIASD